MYIQVYLSLVLLFLYTRMNIFNIRMNTSTIYNNSKAKRYDNMYICLLRKQDYAASSVVVSLLSLVHLTGFVSWLLLYVLLHIVLTIQKKSLVIMRKTKKREQSYVECSLYRIYPHKSDTHVQYPILYGLLLGVHNKTEKNILSGFYS